MAKHTSAKADTPGLPAQPPKLDHWFLPSDLRNRFDAGIRYYENPDEVYEWDYNEKYSNLTQFWWDMNKENPDPTCVFKRSPEEVSTFGIYEEWQFNHLIHRWMAAHRGDGQRLGELKDNPGPQPRIPWEESYPDVMG